MTTDSQPHLPQLIRVERNGFGDFGHIFIDGVPFPYFTKDGPSTEVQRGGSPSITVTIPAVRLEVVDSLASVKGAEADVDAEDSSST
jgi:hypothetical protein